MDNKGSIKPLNSRIQRAEFSHNKSTMKKNNFSTIKKITGICFAAIIIIIIMTSQTKAFGITRSNTEKNPLMIMLGEEGQAYLEYQNMIGEEDYNIKTRIIKGKEIVTNQKEVEKEIQIKAGEEGRRIVIQVEAPKEAKIGEEYEITLTTTLIKTKESTGLTMSTEIEQTIKIIVGTKPEQQKNVPEINNSQEIEQPKKINNYERFLILFISLIGILTLVKILIMINRKK
ncbi:MAG: hypothetical protein AABW73_04430 [Nanoarchaeota archaeon]